MLDPRSQEVKTESRRGPVISSEPAEILLVEDDLVDVRLTREAFENGRINNDLHVVTDGQAALDVLYQCGDYEDAPRPQLVLLDLNLPRVDGLDVLSVIKDDPDPRHLPVIVLGGSEAGDDIARSYEGYANAYLTKPVDPSAYIDLVRSIQEFWFELVRLLPTNEE